jgi:hypothetical protein
MFGSLGGRLSGGILRNSATDIQLAAAPVSYNQVLVTPCTVIVINGLFAAPESNKEQTLLGENIEIANEQRDKIVGTICIF